MNDCIARLMAEGTLVNDDSGRSGLKVYRTAQGYLKIGPRDSLRRAAQMQEYFARKGFAAPLSAYEQDGQQDYLLVPAARGVQALKLRDRPLWLAERLGEGLRRLHEVDAQDCPVRDVNEQAAVLYRRETGHDCPGIESLRADALLHGDACLPNVFLDEEGRCAYIDLGEGGLGDRHFDLYWAVWSLGYNLKTEEYAPRLLDAYGRDAIDDDRLKLCARLSRCAD